MDTTAPNLTFSETSSMNEQEARAYLEAVRWPGGPVCPHCGSRDATALQGKAHRTGLYKCNAKECRQQFTVTVGTIFHRSKISLRLWVMAFAAICASKKGMSALQLMRMLG